MILTLTIDIQYFVIIIMTAYDLLQENFTDNIKA